MHTRFYITWLKIACVLTGVTGIIAMAASTPKGAHLWLALFDMLKWPINNDPSEFQSESLALNAVLGGVMTGWASLMYSIIDNQVTKGNFEMLKYISLSILIWFIVDSAGSILADLPLNVLLNSVFLIIFIIPIRAILKNNKSENVIKN
ncbi:MAG: hypothetical protein C0597_06385 [Marinilabiliales bacterium]|nr:MAG: hypothetical protein C0597_06385 [Marinilabiliales bacterium]